MSSARRALTAAVDVAGRGLDALAPPSPGLTVLAYHQVGGPNPGSVNLPVAAFDEQIAALANGSAVTPIALTDGLDAVAGPDPGPDGPRLVAVTFDDGTADFVDHAVPVLVRHGVPVTLYLATAHVEEGRSFWDDGTVLSWAALAEVCTTGLVTIGCHTHGHVLLDREAPTRVADDLDRARDLIGQHLGLDAVHFAYPKALAPSDANDALVRARFASAALAGGRTNRYGRTDPHRLARTPITVRDRCADVVRKAGGGLRLEGEIRERLDRRRYAGRVS